MEQLLWLETVLKLVGGAVLVLIPGLVIKVLGLPPAERNFWPRAVGALLLGLGAGSFIEGSLGSARGLGLAGSVAINLVSAAVLGSVATLRLGPQTQRGQATLWALVVLLIVLSLFEIAHV